MTTLLNRSNRVNDITRFEISLVRAVLPDDHVEFIAWHADKYFFFSVDPQYIDLFNSKNYCDDAAIRPLDALSPQSPLLVQGDSWLDNPDYINSLEQIVRTNSLRLALHVHDILPVSFPHFFDQRQADQLRWHLNRLSSIVSVFGADSDTTRQDLLRHIMTRRDLRAPIQVIRLGDGLDDWLVQGGAVDSPVSSDVADLVASGRFVLSVCSAAPHKNRELLYRLWSRLVAEKGAAAPMLVVVGRSPSQDDRPAIAAEVWQRIIFIEHASDTDLRAFYRGCLFTVFSSHCEGWGVPISESLAYGKICIAADASSMREIAPHVTDLIDPFDILSWYRRVKLYAFSAEARARREAEIKTRFQPTLWRTTMVQLLDMARSAPAAAIHAASLDFDTPIDLDDMNRRAMFAYDRRPATMNTLGTTSLTFQITTLSEDPVPLDLLCGSTGQGLVEVLLDGAIIDRLLLGQGPEGIQTILLPRMKGHRVITLQFRESLGTGFVPRQFVLRDPGAAAFNRTSILTSNVYVIPYGVPLQIQPDSDQVLGLLLEGWQAPEPTGVWSTQRARLRIAVDRKLTGDLLVSIIANALVSGRLTMRVGTSVVRLFDVEDQIAATYVLEIPSWTVVQSGSYIDIDIDYPAATAPVELGLNQDDRVLGIMLQSLAYESRPFVVLPPETWLDFRHYLFGGWHPTGDSYIWSSSMGCLRLPTDRFGGRHVALTVQAITDLELLVFVGGQLISATALIGLAESLVIVPVPANSQKVIDVVLTCSRTASPQALGLNQDAREIGIRLIEVGAAAPVEMPSQPHHHDKTLEDDITGGRSGSR